MPTVPKVAARAEPEAKPAKRGGGASRAVAITDVASWIRHTAAALADSDLGEGTTQGVTEAFLQRGKFDAGDRAAPGSDQERRPIDDARDDLPILADPRAWAGGA